jgi:hypothetical protein
MYAGQNKEGLATETDEQASVDTPEATSGTALNEDSISKSGEKRNIEIKTGKTGRSSE